MYHAHIVVYNRYSITRLFANFHAQIAGLKLVGCENEIFAAVSKHAGHSTIIH